MKYCPKCKKMTDDSADICKICNIPTQEITDASATVYLVSTGGTDRGRLEAALEDANIPFTTRKYKKMVAADAVIGVDNIDVDVFVPFSAYNDAFDLCVGIGIITPDGTEIMAESIQDNSPSPEAKVIENMSKMSPSKRTAVRICSAVAFILLCALAIYGVDFITGLIKGLFS